MQHIKVEALFSNIFNIYSEKEAIQRETLWEKKKKAKLGNEAKMVNKGDPRLPSLIMDIPKLKLFSG